MNNYIFSRCVLNKIIHSNYEFTYSRILTIRVCVLFCFFHVKSKTLTYNTIHLLNNYYDNTIAEQ